MKKLLIPALLAGVPFGFLMGAAYSLESPVSTSFLVGIISGVGCALAMAGYTLWRQRLFDAWSAKVCAPYEAEGIVHRCYAIAGEAGNAPALLGLLVGAGLAGRLDAGGLLVLTGQRLLFVPHKTNRFGKRLDVPLGEILGVAPGYGFSGRSIRIGTRAKVTLYFKVDDRAKWMDALPGKKLPAPGAGARPAS